MADLVGWLTDVSKPEDGNREMRKAMDREHSAMAPSEAQTIKPADLIDNTLSIEADDPDFTVVFRREKRKLLDVMTKGDPTLMAIARQQLKAPLPVKTLAHRVGDVMMANLIGDETQPAAEIDTDLMFTAPPAADK